MHGAALDAGEAGVNCSSGLGRKLGVALAGLPSWKAADTVIGATLTRRWKSSPSACCVPRFEEGGQRGFKGLEGGIRDAPEVYTCVLPKAA